MTTIVASNALQTVFGGTPQENLLETSAKGGLDAAVFYWIKQMHHFRHGNTSFIFNSDLSGNVDVHIRGHTFEIPGDAMIAFADKLVRDRRIARLESMTDDEIIGDITMGIIYPDIKDVLSKIVELKVELAALQKMKRLLEAREQDARGDEQ